MSFRNRCLIASVNGIQELSIPLEGGRDQRLLMKDLRISYREDWQRKHWGAIYSAYGRSPWFEYYRQELQQFFQNRDTFIVDWNMKFLLWANRQLGISPQIQFTGSYVKDYPPGEYLDLRDWFRPQNRLMSGLDKLPRYRQVFEDRTGFLPGVSILDLLCCEGPGAAGILKNS